MRILGFRSLRRRAWPLALSLAALAAAPVTSACRKEAPKPGLACSLVELRPNPEARFYDAVVRIDAVTIQDARRSRFDAMTPSSTYNVAELQFTEQSSNPEVLAPGDTFIVPLKRPDWKLDIGEGNTVYCVENFWDRLPAKDQWHPTKSEAMTVAQSLDIVNVNGLLKPVPDTLPEEWALVEETPAADNSPVASSLYQKIRGDRVIEQVEVQYTPLTEEEKEALTTTSAVDFLSDYSECARTQGREVVISAHPAVACDLEGVGEFGWTYRFFYVESGLLIAVDVQADPQEWGKTEEEKDQERRTDQVFLRYGYGPMGKEEWQAMVEIRMNRTGAFHKRSKSGESVDKDFTLSDEEFAAIRASLSENHFMELQSRSGGAGGLTSFIAVRAAAKAHTVEMKNYKEVAFDNIAKTIRRVVLPKVGESGF
jgi:hypothetical protein